MSVSNWPLPVFGLAPETMFVASVRTDHGNLAQTGLHLNDLGTSTEAGRAGTMLFVTFARTGTFESKRGSHGVYVGQEPIGKRPVMVYSVDLNADASARAIAYDIEVWCLARIGGCAGPQQAPRVWAMRK